MSLELKVNEQIKEAMLAKEKVRLESLRAIKAGILLAKTAEGGNGEVTDDQVVKLIQKMVKQRKESADIYKQQNRPELAENELAEISYMEVFLPKQLSGEELEAALKAIIERVGAKLPSDMGKVMGVASKELAGLAEGRVISETVKKLLS
jgi:uncharacterized protein YqeY